MPSVAASTTSMPSTLVLPTVRGATIPPSEKCSLDMPAPITLTVDPSHPPVVPAAGMPTPATLAEADTPDRLFVGNPTQNYEEYMGYGMRMQRVRNATTEDDSHGRGRWQYVVIVSTSASGGHRPLP